MQPTIACTIAGAWPGDDIALVQIVGKESEKILPEGTKSSINSRVPAAAPTVTWIQHRRAVQQVVVELAADAAAPQ